MSARQRTEPTAVSLMNNINLELQILLPTFIGRVRRRLYCVSFMATAFWVSCVVKSTAKIHSLHRKTTEKLKNFLFFFDYLLAAVFFFPAFAGTSLRFSGRYCQL